MAANATEHVGMPPLMATGRPTITEPQPKPGAPHQSTNVPAANDNNTDNFVASNSSGTNPLRDSPSYNPLTQKVYAFLTQSPNVVEGVNKILDWVLSILPGEKDVADTKLEELAFATRNAFIMYANGGQSLENHAVSSVMGCIRPLSPILNNLYSLLGRLAGARVLSGPYSGGVASLSEASEIRTKLIDGIGDRTSTARVNIKDIKRLVEENPDNSMMAAIYERLFAKLPAEKANNLTRKDVYDMLYEYADKFYEKENLAFKLKIIFKDDMAFARMGIFAQYITRTEKLTKDWIQKNEEQMMQSYNDLTKCLDQFRKDTAQGAGEDKKD